MTKCEDETEINNDFKLLIGGTIIDNDNCYGGMIKVLLKDGRIAYLYGEGDDASHIDVDIESNEEYQKRLKREERCNLCKSEKMVEDSEFWLKHPCPNSKIYIENGTKCCKDTGFMWWIDYRSYIDNHVMSGGGIVENFFGFNSKTKELRQIYAKLDDNGMSVRIFVNENGNMEIEPRGYD